MRNKLEPHIHGMDDKYIHICLILIPTSSKCAEFMFGILTYAFNSCYNPYLSSRHSVFFLK